MRAPAGLSAWIILCAFCNCAGWILSAVHHLDRIGYALAMIGGLVMVLALGNRMWRNALADLRLGKLRRRFGRGLPPGFLILAALAFLGGALYLPSNYDALAYRTPRVLHWLAEGRWHWIHTDFGRLNTRGCGMEWVTAPLILFTGTDRLSFLINVACFALLPGRVFSVLKHLGVSGRTAWHWMWLLPTGYCYLLQAGSIGNDLFGALFALAAIELALRARQSERPEDLWLSLIAAGLMTAGKAFNELLLLPWQLAVWPALRLLIRRPLLFVLVILMAAGSSLLPTSWLNLRH